MGDTSSPESIAGDRDAPFEPGGDISSHDDATAGEAKRPSALRNAFHLLYSQVLTFAMSIAITIFLPRALGPEGLGQLRLAGAIWGIATVGIGLGTNARVTIETVKRPEWCSEHLPTVLTLRTLAFLVATVGVGVYLALTGASERVVVVFVLTGLSTLPTVTSAVARSAIAGFEQMSYIAVTDVATKAVNMVLVFVMIIIGGDARHFAFLGIVGNTVSVVMMWRFLQRFPVSPMRASLRNARMILGASVGFLVSEAVLIVYLQVDTVVMSTLISERELGWYSTSDTLYASLLFVPGVLLASLFPRIARLNATDPAELQRLVHQAYFTLLLISVPVGLGTVAIASPLCQLLYGDEFKGAADVLGVMGVVLIFGFSTILLGQVAIATGRQRFWNTLMVTAIGVSIALDLLLVPWMDRYRGNGAIAGALSYFVTEGLMIVAGVLYVHPAAGNAASLVRTLKIVLSGVVMFVVTWQLRDGPLPLVVLAGAIVYAACVVASGGVTPEERRASMAFARRVLGRLPITKA